MTTIYFVRHARSDHSVHDEESRPLTLQGYEDAKRVTTLLTDKDISVIYSSPFRRAMDTVSDLAKHLKLDVVPVSAFSERMVGSWVEDFQQFCNRQWQDFQYKLVDGECLEDVQKRNITALFTILRKNQGEVVVIGTHGTALGTILNYFDPSFGQDDFWRLANKMPYLVCFTFRGMELMDVEEIEFS